VNVVINNRPNITGGGRGSCLLWFMLVGGDDNAAPQFDDQLSRRRKGTIHAQIVITILSCH